MNENIDFLASVFTGAIDLQNPTTFEPLLGKTSVELKDINTYKGLSKIQETFKNPDGTFNDELFNNYYNNVNEVYNQFAQADYNYLVKKELESQPVTYKGSLFEQKLPHIKAPYLAQRAASYNPYNQTTMFGVTSDPIKSIEEIRQQTQIWDTEKGEWKQETPESIGWKYAFDIISSPSDVLHVARYDEDTNDFDPMTNTVRKFKKGDLKLNANGKSYYETAGNRNPNEISGESVSYFNIITPEDTFINTLNVFDKDGLEENIAQSIISAGVTAAVPIALSLTGLGTAGIIGYVALKELPKIAEMLTGGKVEGLNKYNNVIDSLTKTTTSEYSQDSPFTFENAMNMMGQAVVQAVQQRGIVQAMVSVPKLLPILSNVSNEKLANAGIEMSRLYMSSVAGAGLYKEASKMGLEDGDARLLGLVTAAGYLGLSKYLQFDEWLFRDMQKNSPALRKAILDMTPKLQSVVSNPSRTNIINQGVVISRGIFDTIKNFDRTAITTSAVGEIMQAGVSEMIEEGTESLLEDFIKGSYDTLRRENIYNPKTSEGKTKGEFFYKEGEYLENVYKNLQESAFGGLVGGVGVKGIYKGMEMLQNKPDEYDGNIIQLVAQGHADKALEMVDKLRDKGMFGSNKLSTVVQDVKGSKILYEPVSDKTQSQNFLIANQIKEQINAINNIFKLESAVKPSTIVDQYDEYVNQIDVVNFNNFYKTFVESHYVVNLENLNKLKSKTGVITEEQLINNLLYSDEKVFTPKVRKTTSEPNFIDFVTQLKDDGVLKSGNDVSTIVDNLMFEVYKKKLQGQGKDLPTLQKGLVAQGLTSIKYHTLLKQEIEKLNTEIIKDTVERTKIVNSIQVKAQVTEEQQSEVNAIKTKIDVNKAKLKQLSEGKNLKEYFEKGLMSVRGDIFAYFGENVKTIDDFATEFTGKPTPYAALSQNNKASVLKSYQDYRKNTLFKNIDTDFDIIKSNIANLKTSKIEKINDLIERYDNHIEQITNKVELFKSLNYDSTKYSFLNNLKSEITNRRKELQKLKSEDNVQKLSDKLKELSDDMQVDVTDLSKWGTKMYNSYIDIKNKISILESLQSTDEFTDEFKEEYNDYLQELYGEIPFKPVDTTEGVIQAYKNIKETLDITPPSVTTKTLNYSPFSDISKLINIDSLLETNNESRKNIQESIFSTLSQEQLTREGFINTNPIEEFEDISLLLTTLNITLQNDVTNYNYPAFRQEFDDLGKLIGKARAKILLYFHNDTLKDIPGFQTNLKLESGEFLSLLKQLGEYQSQYAQLLNIALSASEDTTEAKYKESLKEMYNILQNLGVEVDEDFATLDISWTDDAFIPQYSARHKDFVKKVDEYYTENKDKKDELYKNYLDALKKDKSEDEIKPFRTRVLFSHKSFGSTLSQIKQFVESNTDVPASFFEQKLSIHAALVAVEERKVLTLTSPPGTGKSAIVSKYLMGILSNMTNNPKIYTFSDNNTLTSSDRKLSELTLKSLSSYGENDILVIDESQYVTNFLRDLLTSTTDTSKRPIIILIGDSNQYTELVDNNIASIKDSSFAGDDLTFPILGSNPMTVFFRTGSKYVTNVLRELQHRIETTAPTSITDIQPLKTNYFQEDNKLSGVKLVNDVPTGSFEISINGEQGENIKDLKGKTIDQDIYIYLPKGGEPTQVLQYLYTAISRGTKGVYLVKNNSPLVIDSFAQQSDSIEMQLTPEKLNIVRQIDNALLSIEPTQEELKGKPASSSSTPSFKSLLAEDIHNIQQLKGTLFDFDGYKKVYNPFKQWFLFRTDKNKLIHYITDIANQDTSNAARYIQLIEVINNIDNAKPYVSKTTISTTNGDNYYVIGLKVNNIDVPLFNIYSETSLLQNETTKDLDVNVFNAWLDKKRGEVKNARMRDFIPKTNNSVPITVNVKQLKDLSTVSASTTLSPDNYKTLETQYGKALADYVQDLVNLGASVQVRPQIDDNFFYLYFTFDKSLNASELHEKTLDGKEIGVHSIKHFTKKTKFSSIDFAQITDKSTFTDIRNVFSNLNLDLTLSKGDRDTETASVKTFKNKVTNILLSETLPDNVSNMFKILWLFQQYKNQLTTSRILSSVPNVTESQFKTMLGIVDKIVSKEQLTKTDEDFISKLPIQNITVASTSDLITLINNDDIPAKKAFLLAMFALRDSAFRDFVNKKYPNLELYNQDSFIKQSTNMFFVKTLPNNVRLSIKPNDTDFYDLLTSSTQGKDEFNTLSYDEIQNRLRGKKGTTLPKSAFKLSDGSSISDEDFKLFETTQYYSGDRFKTQAEYLGKYKKANELVEGDNVWVDLGVDSTPFYTDYAYNSLDVDSEEILVDTNPIVKNILDEILNNVSGFEQIKKMLVGDINQYSVSSEPIDKVKNATRYAYIDYNAKRIILNSNIDFNNIDNRKKLTSVLTHEITHALLSVQKRMSIDPKNADLFASKIQSIITDINSAVNKHEVSLSSSFIAEFKDIQRQVSVDRNAGIDEFVTTMFTKKEFVEELSKLEELSKKEKTEQEKTEKPKSFWASFVDAVFKFLGVTPQNLNFVYRTLIAFDELAETTNDFLQEDVETELLNNYYLEVNNKELFRQIRDEFNNKMNLVKNFTTAQRKVFEVFYSKGIYNDEAPFQYHLSTLQQGDLVLSPMYTQENGEWKQIIENGKVKMSWKPVVFDYSPSFSKVVTVNSEGNQSLVNISEVRGIRRKSGLNVKPVEDSVKTKLQTTLNTFLSEKATVFPDKNNISSFNADAFKKTTLYKNYRKITDKKIIEKLDVAKDDILVISGMSDGKKFSFSGIISQVLQDAYEVVRASGAVILVDKKDKNIESVSKKITPLKELQDEYNKLRDGQTLTFANKDDYRVYSNSKMSEFDYIEFRKKKDTSLTVEKLKEDYRSYASSMNVNNGDYVLVLDTYLDKDKNEQKKYRWYPVLAVVDNGVIVQYDTLNNGLFTKTVNTSEVKFIAKSVEDNIQLLEQFNNDFYTTSKTGKQVINYKNFDVFHSDLSMTDEQGIMFRNQAISKLKSGDVIETISEVDGKSFKNRNVVKEVNPNGWVRVAFSYTKEVTVYEQNKKTKKSEPTKKKETKTYYTSKVVFPNEINAIYYKKTSHPEIAQNYKRLYETFLDRYYSGKMYKSDKVRDLGVFKFQQLTRENIGTQLNDDANFIYYKNGYRVNKADNKVSIKRPTGYDDVNVKIGDIVKFKKVGDKEYVVRGSDREFDVIYKNKQTGVRNTNFDERFVNLRPGDTLTYTYKKDDTTNYFDTVVVSTPFLKYDGKTNTPHVTIYRPSKDGAFTTEDISINSPDLVKIGTRLRYDKNNQRIVFATEYSTPNEILDLYLRGVNVFMNQTDAKNVKLTTNNNKLTPTNAELKSYPNIIEKLKSSPKRETHKQILIDELTSQNKAHNTNDSFDDLYKLLSNLTPEEEMRKQLDDVRDEWAAELKKLEVPITIGKKTTVFYDKKGNKWELIGASTDYGRQQRVLINDKETRIVNPRTTGLPDTQYRSNPKSINDRYTAKMESIRAAYAPLITNLSPTSSDPIGKLKSDWERDLQKANLIYPDFTAVRSPNELLMTLGLFLRDTFNFKFDNSKSTSLNFDTGRKITFFNLEGLYFEVKGTGFVQGGTSYNLEFPIRDIINAKYEAELKKLEESIKNNTTQTQQDSLAKTVSTPVTQAEPKVETKQTTPNITTNNEGKLIVDGKNVDEKGKDSVKVKTINRLEKGAINLFNLLSIKGSKLKNPIITKEGTITDIIFEPLDTRFVIERNNQKYLISFEEKTKTWDIAKWDEEKSSFYGADYSVINSLNKKYGSIDNFVKSVSEELHKDILDYVSKKDISLREVYESKYGNIFTTRDFYNEYFKDLLQENQEQIKQAKSISVPQEYEQQIRDLFTQQPTTTNLTQDDSVVDDGGKEKAQQTSEVKLFDSTDKELKKGSVVEYKGEKYLFWNQNQSGKAQLIKTDGTKFSGTPNIDKLTVIGSYKTTMYNNTEYIVTDNGNVYSGATGNLVYTAKDNSTVTQKQRIIEQAKKEALQTSETTQQPTTQSSELSEQTKQQIDEVAESSVKSMSESELIKTFGRDVLQGEPLDNRSTDKDLQIILLTDEEIDKLPSRNYEEYQEYSPAFSAERMETDPGVYVTDYELYMDDYNDRKEQYEKYINSKKEQPSEQLEQAPVTITQGSITQNDVLLNNRIVDFDRQTQTLLYNPTVELYEKVVADYEKQLSSTTDEVLKKNIQSKLDDVKNSFTVTYEQTGQSQESENKDLTNSVDSLMKVVLESDISDKIKQAIEKQITTIISEINNNEKDNVNKKLRTLSGLITPTKNENAISELSKIINICNPK